MREVKTTLGGKRVTLAATWGASMEISEDVGDPMMIAREAAKEEVFAGKGLNYSPSFVFDVENVPQIIWIGIKAGGSDMSIDDVRNLVFDHGFFEAQSIAGEYLSAIVSPTSKESKPAKKGGAGGKS